MGENSKPSINSSLRQERLLRGWSQQVLADKLGTTIVTVSRWERGIQYPGPMMRLKLCMLFEKSESELGLFAEENEEMEENKEMEEVEETEKTAEVREREGNRDTPISASLLAPTSTSTTIPKTEETAEEVIAVEPVGMADTIQETGDPRSYREREKQIVERKIAAQQAHFKDRRSRFAPVRTSARWVIALACVLLVAIGASLFLALYHSPGALSRGSAVTVRATSPAVAVPAAYGVKGKLVFDNTLRDEANGKLWDPGDPSKTTGCHFLNGAYDMRDVATNYCLASNTDFANFVYQIEMTTMQEQAGQTGGIVFRADDAQDAYYDFQIGADGSYNLFRSDSTGDVTISEGRSTAIIQGDLHPNVLAVKAIGKDLSLYVNLRLVAHVQDPIYMHGNIGVGIVVNKGETEVAFRDARVWAL